MSKAEFSALLRRFCVAILATVKVPEPYWQGICNLADQYEALGQKALDELLAVDPNLGTVPWNAAEPTLKNLAAGYVEPPEGDPLSPPVGLSTDALGRLMIAHDWLLSGARIPVGALVQAGSPAPPAVVELADRLTPAQWNAEGEQARKVIEAVLALNGSPLVSSKASAPREEILAEGATPEAPPPTPDDDGARSLLPEEIPELSRVAYWVLSSAAGLVTTTAQNGDLGDAIGFVLSKMVEYRAAAVRYQLSPSIPGWVLRAKGERARSLVKQILVHPSNAAHGLQAFDPKPDLLAAMDALRKIFKISIAPDPNRLEAWTVRLAHQHGGAVVEVSNYRLEDALSSAQAEAKKLLESQQKTIGEALALVGGGK